MKTLIFLYISLFFLIGCSQPAPQPEQAPPPPRDQVQCYEGCALSVEGNCQLLGNVVDGSTVEIEVIPCDPRCCEPSFIADEMVPGASLDADGDGVRDELDECPTEPGDRDGFREDGCPE